MDYSKQIIADKKQEEKSHLKTATLKRQTLEEFFQFWQEGKKKERNFKGLTDEQQEKIKDQETQLMCRDWVKKQKTTWFLNINWKLFLLKIWF